MEEIDLCWRLKNAGYCIFYQASSEIYHVGGGTLNRSNPQKTFYNFRNNLVMLLKNLPPVKAAYIIFLRLLLDGVMAVRFLFLSKHLLFGAVIRAHFSFYKYLLDSKKKYRTNKYLGNEDLYPRSIAWDYFIKNKKKFSDLLFR